MTTLARKYFNLNDHDNMTLTPDNLDNVACQRNDDYKNETTAWIFEHKSALIVDSFNDWKIVTNYGFHRDHIKL